MDNVGKINHGDGTNVWGDSGWDAYTNTGIGNPEKGQFWMPLKEWKQLASHFPSNELLVTDSSHASVASAPQVVDLTLPRFLRVRQAGAPPKGAT